MSNHVITIHAAGVSRRADISEIQLQSGDNLVFKTEAGAASILCLGTAINQVISPTPASSNVELAGGSSVSFVVGNVAAGNYCILLQAHGWPCPTRIQCDTKGDGAHLSIRSARSADFPEPQDIPVGTS
jgi:hypothetical protein